MGNCGCVSDIYLDTGFFFYLGGMTCLLAILQRPGMVAVCVIEVLYIIL